ncbi:uncharacterized protein DFL_002988 [Arthrobotrys flagrans]|uniref:Uncharacterized protein n=1 Tax=Arthrobotrys flagrans TaxID=97331 RepID=A0A437AC18_ARTFL|nr:hypothetical protein DFL_002988 [Arthrobotrys flagrans]
MVSGAPINIIITSTDANNLVASIKLVSVTVTAVDFTGVRIALYSQDDSAKAKGHIEKLFYVERAKELGRGEGNADGYAQRRGYVADHYLVYLREGYNRKNEDGNKEVKKEDTKKEDIKIEDCDKKPRIEIQVAFVLMHTWSEVNHDISYKQINGQAFKAEFRILDSLDGLVLAGELLLQQLQAATEARLSSALAANQKFAIGMS